MFSLSMITSSASGNGCAFLSEYVRPTGNENRILKLQIVALTIQDRKGVENSFLLANARFFRLWQAGGRSEPSPGPSANDGPGESRYFVAGYDGPGQDRGRKAGEGWRQRSALSFRPGFKNRHRTSSAIPNIQKSDRKYGGGARGPRVTPY